VLPSVKRRARTTANGRPLNLVSVSADTVEARRARLATSRAESGRASDSIESV
jgi:hypothetical protein